MPWKIAKETRGGTTRYCVHKEKADGSLGETVKCHATMEQAKQHMAALYANVPDAREISGAFSDVLVVTELRGGYPDVPYAPGVDIAELTAGDSDPMFLVLPIGKAGVTSGNGRHYDEAFLQELERQTIERRPVGLMGHLRPEDRATAFPEEAIHWLGAARQGDLLWGKGYVPPGAVRDRIRRYKAQGKAIATSIDALAEGVWDETVKAHRMDAKTLRLGQIDIAPADRAGIPDLAAVPLLTTEMADEIEPELEDEVVDKLQVINEMTPEDARLLPEPVRAAILAQVQAPPEVAQMQSVRETLGLDAKADVAAAIAEMKRTQEAAAKQAVSDRITELVADQEKGIKLEAVRPLVVELVTARNPQTVQEAEAAYTQVRELESVKKLLAGTVRETMGPAQGTPLQAQNGGGNKYFVIPKED